MRKISLAALGLYLGILASFAQTNASSDTTYKSRKLKVEEINFVSGYYHQDGNNSAVTGGIGTEKLTDIANTIDLKLSGYDSKQHKVDFTFEMGVDHYTSASSDKIDPRTISSASMSDTRFYPSASWNITNEKTGVTLGANASFSKEFDYTSFGGGLNFIKSSKDHNREFSAKLQAFADTWKVLYAYELKPVGYSSGAERDNASLIYSPRNSYSASLSYMQVISKSLQVMFIAEPTFQKGLLATDYQRVYFNNGGEKIETLPDKRYKIPLGIRANYFIGDRFIIRSFYRYYMDDWGLKAHTIDIEVPVKLTSFFSVSPFYRFYMQNAVDYFAPYAQHSVSEKFFTSDYDLSKFTSHFYGAGIRTAPPKGVFGIQKFGAVELRYGHYTRSNGLHSDQVSVHLTLH